MESGRSRLHTNSEQHNHRCSTNQQSAREGLELLKQSGAAIGSVGGNSRLQKAMNKRDFLLWGEMECAENQTVTQYCSVCATWRRFKRRAEVAR